MTTINLKLPELAESQAGKAITHNEALHALDALVNCGVIDRDLTAPPGSPVDGDVYIPKATATGAWAGKENQLAQWDVTAWRFHVPEEGWICYVQDEDALLVYTGSAWAVLAGGSATQSANQVYAGPISGAAAAPAFRALVAADIPAQPYVIAGFCPGVPVASQVILVHVFTDTVTLPSGLGTSKALAQIAATASTVFDIAKWNGTSWSNVGTATFAAAGTTATFAMASGQTLNAGDALRIIAPASADATISDVTFSVRGTR